MRKLLAVGLATVLGCAAGCTSDGRPAWGGSMARQRQQAQHFDPYADPTAGPVSPEARPRDYASPAPEPTRARWRDYGEYRYGNERQVP